MVRYLARCFAASSATSSQYASQTAEIKTMADLLSTSSPYRLPGASPPTSAWMSKSRWTSFALRSKAFLAWLGTVMLCLMFTVTVRAGAPPGAWTGPYSPCDEHAEILKQGPMNLGVRFSTSNPTLKTEFAHAMSFWASVLDMNWHEEDSRACAIQAVDGVPDLFVPGAVARAQFPGQPEYQGWIAFNPRRSLPANELFLTAVHEFGHVLGLPHSANSSSAMYFLVPDGPVILDSADLAALATRHRLRAAVGKGDVPQLSLLDWRRMWR